MKKWELKKVVWIKISANGITVWSLTNPGNVTVYISMQADYFKCCLWEIHLRQLSSKYWTPDSHIQLTSFTDFMLIGSLIQNPTIWNKLSISIYCICNCYSFVWPWYVIALGQPLIAGLTEVANKRPQNPIKYLANYLNAYDDSPTYHPRVGLHTI